MSAVLQEISSYRAVRSERVDCNAKQIASCENTVFSFKSHKDVICVSLIINKLTRGEKGFRSDYARTFYISLLSFANVNLDRIKVPLGNVQRKIDFPLL